MWWFKKSSVQLSASVVSALYAKNSTTACIFFVMGVFVRMKENEEEERKGYVVLERMIVIMRSKT